ncbi:MAG: ABC transporter permease [Terriglobales bacterium]
MSNLLQDVRYAFRQLYKSPGFAFTALFTLAVGIGANVVVFGVVNSLLLNPLPVPHPERIYTVEHRAKNNPLNSSFPQYLDLRDRNRVFSGLAATRVMRIGLEASEVAQPVWGYEVSGNYFETLGVRPVLGRFLTPSDEQTDHASEVAVLSYACWKSRFGGDPNVVGSKVRINKHPYTVIGVAPASFQGTEKMFWPEVWLPILNEQQIEGYNWIHQRTDVNSWVVGRLKDGITEAQAEANLNSVAAQLAHEYPNTDEHVNFRLSRPGFLGDMLGGPVRGFMFGVMLLAGLVLLAACMNLGGLLAARTSDRARELAIRVAIGSSRSRILRQLIVESVVVALAGGVFALLVSAVLLRLISEWRPIADFPVQFLVQPDKKVYLFAFLISTVTGLIFGCTPARQIWKTDPNHVLRAGSGTAVAAGRLALRDVLLGVQIAVCCLLVTACFVSLRGLQRTLITPLAFDAKGVTLANFDLYLADYKDSQVPHVQQQLLDSVSHLPGVTAAAFSNSTPLALDQSSTSVFDASVTEFRASAQKFTASYYQVSPGYFATAGTRLLAGREFNWHDDKAAPKVAVVNAAFARRLFGTEHAIGKLFHSHGEKPWEIVGVAEDGKYENLLEDSKPAIFYPILQMPNTSTTLIVRSGLPPAQMIPAVREAIYGVDRSIPIFTLSSWQDSLGFMMLPTLAATVALTVFGSLAIILALTGLFGLASYTVSKRLRELGIRVALGAQQAQVLRAALSRTVLLLAVGSTTGLVLGVAASKVLASIVYHVSASDPVVLLGVAVTMALVGLLAASIPARRALAINPMDLLREQ